MHFLHIWKSSALSLELSSPLVLPSSRASIVPPRAAKPFSLLSLEHPTACAHMVQESSLAHPDTFWETYFGCLNKFYRGCNTRSSQVAEKESEETLASPLLRNERCPPRAVVFLCITAALLWENYFSVSIVYSKGMTALDMGRKLAVKSPIFSM